MSGPRGWWLAAGLAVAGSAAAQQAEATAAGPPGPVATATASVRDPLPATRSGREIYQHFREGLADPSCPGGSSPRWRSHFAAAPKRLADAREDVLPLFGYVVDAMREASLPTEYALIPFVESGYNPGARSPGGPAGLWQFIALTARNHQVPVRGGYDGRLSPVESTRAAVRYLKTLHGMFAGDWRLAVMAYNAGEYRVLGALRRAGQNARNARPDSLPGLSGITHAYVQKLRALSCLLEQADDREEWLQALDRPVPVLSAQVLPVGVRDLDGWAQARGIEAGVVRRLNPAFANGRIARAGEGELRVLAPRLPVAPPDVVVDATELDRALATHTAAEPPADQPAQGRHRSHTVARGDSLWSIARRYNVATSALLARNRLDARTRLKPGMVLQIDEEPASGAAP